MLTPIGFWSYATSDDAASRGRLGQLRALLADALQANIGRPKVNIFQDVAAIPFGANWEKEIRQALEQSSFFIPIITPAFLHSEWCCREVLQFRERQAALGRDDLIFPVHYLDVSAFETVRRAECFDAAVLDYLRTHQWVDFRRLRLLPLDTDVEVAQKLDEVASAICGAMYRTVAAEPVAATVPVVPARPTEPRPGSVMRDGADLPEMVLVPPGRFVMGVPPEEEERENLSEQYRGRSQPLRDLTIANGFYLGRYPVTRGEFAAFAAATGRKMPNKAWTFEADTSNKWTYAERANRDWRNPGFAQTERHPVVCVCHGDAAAYARWLSDRTGKDYRLPSEAEWEYAARAGTTTARFWGDDRGQATRFANVADETLRQEMGAKVDPEVFFVGNDGFPFTSPVRSFPANGFELCDMLGNVWEWVADPWHDNYQEAPTDGSVWTTGGSAGPRVLRGGSWVDGPRGGVRAGYRDWGDPGYRNGGIGFRLARTL